MKTFKNASVYMNINAKICKIYIKHKKDEYNR